MLGLIKCAYLNLIKLTYYFDAESYELVFFQPYRI